MLLVLSGAAVRPVLLADASQMSKAEVERIWLPFVPWLLLSCALLPERWRRTGLVVQVGLALVVQHLLRHRLVRLPAGRASAVCPLVEPVETTSLRQRSGAVANPRSPAPG